VQTLRLDDGVIRTDLPNGLVVLTERMPALRSAAAGFWVKTASAHEPREKMGVSHLLEHMVFKGTERRSAQDIAVALESRGGALDAYTGRDHTTFQARMLDADLPLAVDLLTDIVRRPLLRDADFALERNVVLEEIATVEDTPDDLVFDLHSAALWRAHSYGYRILGTRETVSGATTDDLKALHARTYLPRQLVFAAAGNVDHAAVLGMLEREGWFDLTPGPDEAAVAVPVPSAPLEERFARDGAQVHLVFGTATFRFGDPRRHALVLVSTILGGGMSSRLFQRVREELGLAYSVYAFHALHQASGVAGVYVGTQPPTAERAAAAIREELARLARDSVSAQELAMAKQQVKGQLVLALEGPVARMYRLAGAPLYGEPYRTLDTTLAEIDAVRPETVAEVAAEFYAPERQVVVWLGPS
jgi:predicted Zn-dependent peptidase